jgi:hypothetical protein
MKLLSLLSLILTRVCGGSVRQTLSISKDNITECVSGKICLIKVLRPTGVAAPLMRS